MITTCPHCQKRVLFRGDGSCPSCNTITECFSDDAQGIKPNQKRDAAAFPKSPESSLKSDGIINTELKVLPASYEYRMGVGISIFLFLVMGLMSCGAAITAIENERGAIIKGIKFSETGFKIYFMLYLHSLEFSRC